MTKRRIAAGLSFALVCAISVGVGGKMSQGAPAKTGPCPTHWSCQGTYGGYWTKSPPWGAPYDTNNCVLIINTVPTCGGTNQSPCDAYYTCNNLPLMRYMCRGTDPQQNNMDCWTPFCGCQ